MERVFCVLRITERKGYPNTVILNSRGVCGLPYRTVNSMSNEGQNWYACGHTHVLVRRPDLWNALRKCEKCRDIGQVGIVDVHERVHGHVLVLEY